MQKVWSNLRKYQRLGLLEKSYPCTLLLSPTRCFSCPRIYDSDAEDYSSQPSWDVPPQGHLAVYVGPARLRFLMKTEYLNHPLFRELLDKSEEEFGHHYSGGLIIDCEVEVFENLLWRLANGSSYPDPSATPGASAAASNLTLGQLFNLNQSVMP